ncbi:MAG: hypothetical protein EP330_23545 [Deltaproteobacteria bacterium]|nr:MAG: hypothetical protein EP330_23545 [Deltaproteobacteria bacterium]
MLLLLATLSAAATEWYADLGGQFDADGHGIASVVMKDGPWSVALYTDTLELRAAPELDRGRAWAAVRAEAGAAGLLISPWEDGAPAPEQALIAGYFGADGGAVRYLPHGLWVGGELRTRAWWFLPMESTTIEVPGWTNVATVDALAGWWTTPASVDVALGTDLRDDRLSPHVTLRARWTPEWTVRPVVRVWAGWADGQDRLTRTRLGGLNPYVVPLAGAAWAEFLVEDYAAAQVGPELHLERWSLALLADVAHFSRRTELGLEPRLRVQPGKLGFDLAFGYAPTLERQQGTALSAYALVHWRHSP